MLFKQSDLIMEDCNKLKKDMVFVIKPLNAQLAEDHDLIGKSDPYCLICIGGEKFKSKTAKGAGKTPKWNDSFTFNGNANDLKIQVYDDDMIKDDLYGEGSINLGPWLAHPNQAHSESVEIFDKKKKAGIVTLSIEYQGPVLAGNQPIQAQNTGGYINPGNLGY